jgi:hypothetical protein
MQSENYVLGVIIAIALLPVFLYVLGPFLTIWSLNILFGLKIPTTFWTWLAMLWIHVVITTAVKKAKNE